MTRYKLTNETKEHNGVILHRIELTADCQWGKKGTKGGWVQSSDNLSEDAWVHGNALVFGSARVFGNSCVSGDAWVGGNALVYGNARVWGDSCVSGYAMVSGNAYVYEDAHVWGNARVYGYASIHGNARVFGDVWVNGNIIIKGGEWDENIMYLQIREGISMNMSAPGILRIGNIHKSIGEWLEDKNYKYRRYVWIFADEYGLGDVHNCDQEK